ncbi:MAG: M3 family metallopeptidase [Verrucomicrobiota bacterium]|nr:M3 family metallopeptidase [Verrucomicrobiota bacterium]
MMFFPTPKLPTRIQVQCTLIAALSFVSTLHSQKAVESNPLLSEWTTPFGVPPFETIKPVHFMPAYEAALAEQLKAINVITDSKDAPTFLNTVVALENSDLLLRKIRPVFDGISSAETNEELQAIEEALAPILSKQNDDITLNAALFQRVKTLWDGREKLGLNGEDAMLLEKTWKGFVRGGALLDAAKQTRLRAINSEMATLSVSFGSRNLSDTNAFRLVIDNPADLAGLPEPVRSAAADAAKQAGLSGKWVFTLKYPSIWPFLQYSENRELRRKLFAAYTTRGELGNAADTREIIAKMAALRAEQAQLLGYETWADFVLDERMAKTPARVYDLLNRVWAPARVKAEEEVRVLQAAIKADGKDFTLEPSDWFYYTEKVRKSAYAIDESVVRPYFELERVRDGAFEVARRLYGITFTPLKDMPVYHSEVKAFEVKDRDGSHLGVFYTDFHPRPGKQSGAWCGGYRDQNYLDGKNIRPIVVNVCNFTRPSGDTPALLSLDEVETLFHEFGHALHGLLSQVHYSTTGDVPRDFVELPSQIMENWATEPEVLALYAHHWKTGEVIPIELVNKIRKARQFNQGFASVEYLAACYLDMDWHTLTNATPANAAALERIALARIGMPSQIVPRYRSTYFRHIFSDVFGYSTGYYSYLWSEVLDADAFQAFKETSLFDQKTATSFRKNILEAGGTEEAMKRYLKFRGREPVIDSLLIRRGLMNDGQTR